MLNIGPDKYPGYEYRGYDIGFDTQVKYSLIDGSVGKNVIIFGANMSSSVHIDNKGKSISILGKGVTQGLNHALAAETQFTISFTRPAIKFCLSLHYNRSNSFLFVNATKIYSFKAKNIPRVLEIFQEIFQPIR